MMRKKTILKYSSLICLIFTLLFMGFNMLSLDELHLHSSWNESLEYENLEPQYVEDGNQGSSEPGNTPMPSSSPAPAGSPVPETPKKSRPSYRIFVNLDELKMFVYKDEELIKIYPVSGGKKSTPSPEGTWKIITKDTWGEGFGGYWMGLNVPWGKYGIHGTVYPWTIGKRNESKGCIRMLNKDAKELYHLVPHGTIVTISHQNKPFRNMRSGDIGSDVLDMQKKLKELGYYKVGLDGKFGKGLTEAVKAFQKEYRLYQTGVINISTYNKINEMWKNSHQEAFSSQ
jgi:hypothetical protein